MKLPNKSTHVLIGRRQMILYSPAPEYDEGKNGGNPPVLAVL